MPYAIRLFSSLLIVSLFCSSCGKLAEDPGKSSDPVAISEAPSQPSAPDDPHAGHDHAGHDHASHAHSEGPNPHLAADHFIVEVNGTKLAHGELDGMIQQMAGRQLQQIPEQMRGQFMQQMMPRFQQQAVDRFISGTLLSTEADKQQIVAPDDELNEMIAEFKQQIPADVKWEDALKQMGTTDKELRGEMANDIKIRALLKKQFDALPKPPEAELKTVYEKDPKRFAQTESASARHVLLKFEPTADEATKKAKMAEIEALRKKIVDGADFAEIAKAHSDCPSKAEGGDLGSFGRGQMVPPFAEAVFKQDLNMVGDVIETKFGYHLIEVTERKEAKELSFAEAQEQISAELSQEAEGEAITAYIAQLRETAQIKYGEGHAPPPAAPVTPAP
ncbi:MAG: peptidyl-prolyl cis-trans isomerase C [Rhodothermales bacterium]|jgi:peptidyl-prolyl cis-trans isomerase C